MALEIPGFHFDPLDDTEKPHRTASAAEVTAGTSGEVVPLPPTSAPGIAVGSGPNMVPLRTDVKAVVAQTGTFTALHVQISTVSLHPDGDLTARSQAYNSVVAWILEALDSKAKEWNGIRGALGQRGDWTPSGNQRPAQVDARPPWVEALQNDTTSQ